MRTFPPTGSIVPSASLPPATSGARQAPPKRLSIRELPRAERPRERLKAHGVHALSSAELLAVIVGTGAAGRSALAVAHEVNPAKPVSETIAALHDRTVEQVAQAAGMTVEECGDHDGLLLLDSSVMNHALRKHVLVNGVRGVIGKLMIPVS